MSDTNEALLPQPNITFTIIKSDAVRNGVSDAIITTLCNAGFFIVHRDPNTRVKLSMAQTVKFYYEHVGRPYFPQLIKSLTDGCIPLILEYSDQSVSAVKKLRDLIGATKSRDAAPNTIRGMFGGHLFNVDAPVAENAIHGSDSLISAINEIKTVFPELTEIKSLSYGVFQLDQFQVGVAKLPEKIKILRADYEEFMSKRNKGIISHHVHPLGRAFYDHFKLHESILKDNASLQDLYLRDGEDAIACIGRIVEFI